MRKVMRLHLGGLCRIAAASLLCVGFAAKPTMAQIVPIDVVGNFGSFNEYNTNFAPQTYKDWGLLSSLKSPGIFCLLVS